MTSNTHADSSKVIGIAATLLFHVGLLLLVLCVWLKGPDDVTTEPLVAEEEEPEITFEEVVDLIAGGTFVEAQFIPPTPEPKLSTGSNVEAAPPTPPQPTLEEIQEKKRKEIKDNMTFNTSTKTEEIGDGGDAPSSVPAMNIETENLDGLALDMGSFTRPHGLLSGKICIQVTVDPDGRIIDAKFVGYKTDYEYTKDRKAVDNCIKEAKRSRFKLIEGAEAKTRIGYVYYKF